MANCFDRPLRRRGYTLLEMLIVVALIASLVALSLPAMRGPLGKSELRNAAGELCNQLATARLDAIESGVARQFRFQPGRRRFEIARRPISTSSTGLPFRSRVAAVHSVAVEPPVQEAAVVHDLPDGLCFLGQETAELSVDTLLPDAGADAAAWSTPIVFYPNGRSSHATIRIRGQRDFHVDVTLRGLTGTATFGRLARQVPPEEESP